MTIPTVPLNEDSPAGGDFRREGDDRIREYKLQNREILEIDHVYPDNGQDADAGKHKQVSLVEAADIGTGEAGEAVLGAQTCDGKPELVFTDEDDTDVQITSEGELYPGAAPTLSKWAAILELIYPVGIVVTLGVSTNPATLFGIGTWVAIAGKVVVGINALDTEFDTLDETGGAKTVTLTSAQSGVPAHTHTIPAYFNDQDDNYVGSANTTGGNGTATTAANAAANAAEAHSNLQPYIVKYVWQRTA